MLTRKIYRLSDVVQFNPPERLAKGTIAKKVAMEQLLPYVRAISGYEMAAYSGGSKFRNGDTLMARITPCLENGKTAYVSILADGEVGFGSTEYIVFRNIEGVTDSKFIYYFVTNPWFRNIAIKSMVGSSGRQRVQQSVLENLEINLPPLAEQKRIAAILGALDDKIELNRRINANLEEQAKTLFNQMFISSNDWKYVALGDVTTEIKERVNNRHARVLSPVNTGKLVLSEDYFTKQVYSQDISKYIVVEPYSFAYNPARINIGSIGMNTNEYMGCVSPMYVVFKTQEDYRFFFNLYIRTKSFQEEVKARAMGGVRQTLSYKDFSLIRVKYPSRDVVGAFNVIYRKQFMQINHNNIEIQKLSTLRDTLLPKLMNGEITIDNVSLDYFTK